MAHSEVGKIDQVLANEVRAGGIVATIWQAVHERELSSRATPNYILKIELKIFELRNDRVKF